MFISIAEIERELLIAVDNMLIIARVVFLAPQVNFC